MKRILLMILFVVGCYVAGRSADVKVTWDHGGVSNSALGYNIYYGPSNRNYTNFVTTGYVTNVVISNIPSYVPFYFSGTTLGFDGSETSFGNELQFTASPFTNGLPSVVKDFTITKVIHTIY